MKKGRTDDNHGVVPARVGREKQRYDGENRLVVGTIAFQVGNQNDLFVLLVNSTKYADEWTVPKGGWETDESAPQGAMRETLEEAGARGEILMSLVKEKLEAASQIHEYFALRIQRLEEEWAEKSKRVRKVVPINEAIEILSNQTRRKDKNVQLNAIEALKETFGH